MPHYLTTKAIFKCELCPSTQIQAVMPKSTVRFGNNPILTQDAMLQIKTPGTPCPPLSGSGAPAPCSFPGISCKQLIAGFDPTRMVDGSPILTHEAKGICPVGGGMVSVLLYPDTMQRFLRE